MLTIEWMEKRNENNTKSSSQKRIKKLQVHDEFFSFYSRIDEFELSS